MPRKSYPGIEHTGQGTYIHGPTGLQIEKVHDRRWILHRLDGYQAFPSLGALSAHLQGLPDQELDEVEPTTATAVRLTEEERELARELGNGSLSSGIREALRRAALSK